MRGGSHSLLHWRMVLSSNVIILIHSQLQTYIVMSNLWSRPTALSLAKYATMSATALMEHYRHDNERAADNGVCVPPRSATLRVCQWNVHYFVQPHGAYTTTTHNHIYDELLRQDADVLVLQEFCTSDWETENRPFLQRLQNQAGYGYARVAATSYPTVVLIKRGSAVVAVDSIDDFALDDERRAVVMRMTLVEDQEQQFHGKAQKRHVWLYGTHLHHVEDFPGRRHAEMQTLLRHVKEHCRDNDEGVLIIGDFNQQRSCDYTTLELNNIVANRKHRGEETRVEVGKDNTTPAAAIDTTNASTTTTQHCVTTLLEEAGFTCSWDKDDSSSLRNQNWPQDQPPPATHWSGTVIDYAYGKHLRNVGTYVSPAGWSDHRLIVTDWASS